MGIRSRSRNAFDRTKTTLRNTVLTQSTCCRSRSHSERSFSVFFFLSFFILVLYNYHIPFSEMSHIRIMGNEGDVSTCLQSIRKMYKTDVGEQTSFFFHFRQLIILTPNDNGNFASTFSCRKQSERKEKEGELKDITKEFKSSLLVNNEGEMCCCCQSQSFVGMINDALSYLRRK